MESKGKAPIPASVFADFQSSWHERLHHHGASQALHPFPSSSCVTGNLRLQIQDHIWALARGGPGTPRPTLAAGMRGASRTDCLPAKSWDGARRRLRPQGSRLVHGPGLMSRRLPRAHVELLLGTQEHRTRGPARTLDRVCAVCEAEGHFLRTTHLKIQRKTQLQK